MMLARGLRERRWDSPRGNPRDRLCGRWRTPSARDLRQGKADHGDEHQHGKRDQDWTSFGVARGRSCVHALALLAKRSRSMGSRLTATPAAAKIALRSAGGPAVAPVSPTPQGGSPLLIKCTSIFGIWSMRNIR